MDVIDTVAGLQACADRQRAEGLRIALVPTMGALHAGHLSLVERARALADRVYLSIFVNPTQFNEPGDLEHYPRTLEADLAACRAAGVDVVFHPTAAEMYPEGSDTVVAVDALTRPLCGATRPGHFQGVTTVVTKLLMAAKPHFALFGEKDYQQLAVIRRMARDLRIDVEIVGVPILREADGLAMSSRNRQLDPEARAQALVLVRALEAAESALAAGERDHAKLVSLARHEIGKAPRAAIDYLELRDSETLEPAPERLAGPALLALAVFMRPSGAREGASAGGVRLIDNRVLDPGRGAAAGAPAD